MTDHGLPQAMAECGPDSIGRTRCTKRGHGWLNVTDHPVRGGLIEPFSKRPVLADSGAIGWCQRPFTTTRKKHFIIEVSPQDLS